MTSRGLSPWSGYHLRFFATSDTWVLVIKPKQYYIDTSLWEIRTCFPTKPIFCSFNRRIKVISPAVHEPCSNKMVNQEPSDQRVSDYRRDSTGTFQLVPKKHQGCSFLFDQHTTSHLKCMLCSFYLSSVLVSALRVINLTVKQYLQCKIENIQKITVGSAKSAASRN